MGMKVFIAGTALALFAGFGAPAIYAAPAPAVNVAATAPQPVAETPEHAAKVADIHKLMDVTGSGQIGVQVLNQVIAQFKSLTPNVPQKFWDEITKETSPDELVNLIVPIYDKYLTDAEIRGLIQFYQSPLGTKLINVMPQITRDSMAAGRQWGMQIVEKVESKLQSEGYENGNGNGGNSTTTTPTK